MKNAGVVSSVAEGRQYSRNSFDLKSYEPAGSSSWATEFVRYCDVTRKQAT